MVGIAAEQVVLVGYSQTLLTPLVDILPAGSVVVVEEPDVAAKRDVPALAAGCPAISRVVLWEYQRPEAMAAFVRAEPAVKAAVAVLPGIEYAVTGAAELADLLGLPGAGTEAGLTFRDKVRQREVAARAGLRNPAYRVIADESDAVDFQRMVGGRCVIKPTAHQASLGVRFATGADEVRTALRQARAAVERRLVPDRGIASRVLVEQAIDGTEYSVELLVASGDPVFANVTAKRVLPGPFPVEIGHVVPGAAGELATRLVTDTALLATAAGFCSGILHCEWIVDADGPVLVECAARMPGDEIGTLISLAYDIPLTHAYLRVLLGEVPQLPRTPSGGAAIQFLTALPGTVERVTGADEAAGAAGVRAVKVSVKEGDRLASVTSSWNRSGYVIACADTGAQAEACAAAAAELIQVHTRPGIAG